MKRTVDGIGVRVTDSAKTSADVKRGITSLRRMDMKKAVLLILLALVLYLPAVRSQKMKKNMMIQTIEETLSGR